MTKAPSAPIDSIIKIGKNRYKICGSPIENGDRIWNEASKQLDTCIQIFEDGDICVEFGEKRNSAGSRAVLNKIWFQRAVDVKQITVVLEGFRNKSCVRVAQPRANELLRILKGFLSDDEFLKLYVAHQHYLIGEGPEECYDVCKELIKKYHR